MLARNPKDKDALFSLVTDQRAARRLRGHDREAQFRQPRLHENVACQAESCWPSIPTCYDAYLAIGVENYLLGSKSCAGALGAAHDWRADRQGRRYASACVSPPPKDITWRPSPACCWPSPPCATRTARPRAPCSPAWPANSPAISFTPRNSRAFSNVARTTELVRHPRSHRSKPKSAGL